MAARVVEETFTLQRAHLHPVSGPLLDRYADAFSKVFEHLDTVGRKAPGNRGVLALRRVRDQKAELVLITLWDSWGAIERFAGPEADRAVYYAEDARYLTRMDPEVAHYEVVEMLDVS